MRSLLFTLFISVFAFGVLSASSTDFRLLGGSVVNGGGAVQGGSYVLQHTFGTTNSVPVSGGRFTMNAVLSPPNTAVPTAIALGSTAARTVAIYRLTGLLIVGLLLVTVRNVLRASAHDK